MGLLRFWKNRIFVRLMVEKETEKTKKVLMVLGKYIASAIQQEGKKPRLVEALPIEGLIKDSIHYFHKNVLLNIHYYLADSNILNLSGKTEVVLARYQMDGQKIRLLVVRYQKPNEANEVYKQFSRLYLPEKPIARLPVRIEKVENSEFIGVRWMERFIILVFEGKDKETIGRFIEAVARNMKEVY